MQESPCGRVTPHTLEAESPPDRTRTPPWWRVTLAPVLDLFRPRAAAAVLLSASRPAFAAVLILSLVGYAGTLILLVLWHDTLIQQVPSGPPAASSAPFLQPMSFELQQRSIAEVWCEWHAGAIGGWLGPLEIALVLVPILGLSALLFLAWLNFPLVHSTGSVWCSYKRALRASTGILWPLEVLTLPSGAAAVATAHTQLRTGVMFSASPFDEPAFVLLLCAAASAALLMIWLRVATDGAAPVVAEIRLPPRCEGCGYDLTHRPADQRCPECGLDLDASLEEARSRPGSAWSTARTGSSWRSSAWQVLFRPGTFYRALKLRSPAAAEAAFARRNYCWITCGACVWAVGMVVLISLTLGPPAESEIAALMAGGCAALALGVVGCWFGHRLVAACVATWWLGREALPDFRWAVRVMAYETTFLWVFCVFWGLLMALFVLAEGWLTALVQALGLPPYLLGAPLGVFTIGAGTLALGALWVWRYIIAWRAIRWSNF